MVKKYLKSYVVQLKDGRKIEAWDAMDIDSRDVECLVSRGNNTNAVVYPALTAYRELEPFCRGMLKSKIPEGVRKLYAFGYQTWDRWTRLSRHGSLFPEYHLYTAWTDDRPNDVFSLAGVILCAMQRVLIY